MNGVEENKKNEARTKVSRFIEKNMRCRKIEAKHKIDSIKAEGVLKKVMKD